MTIPRIKLENLEVGQYFSYRVDGATFVVIDAYTGYIEIQRNKTLTKIAITYPLLMVCLRSEKDLLEDENK